MEPLNFAALGLLLIGMITTGLIAWFTLRRTSDSKERQKAIRWIVIFGLSICTFLSATPLLGQNQIWFLLLPFAATGWSLDSLHRIVENVRRTQTRNVSETVSGESAR